ncbi:MAG: amidohydrolase [Synergistes sp.]|nr:amidohydrolase [Synergistes sp.]
MEENIIQRIYYAVESLKPELTELTLKIHDNPEPGGKERKAVLWQTALLRKYGFEVTDKYCGIETAYRAVYRGAKAGPKIALPAEYDALPGIGHGCGHNLIAMMSVGTGIVLREFADEFGGEINVFGTPAEETEGAKVAMAKMGAFDDIDAAMMSHPSTESTSSVNSMALCCRTVEFFGKTSHAASAPEDGINALDAMINFFNLVNALRQQTRPDVRLHGIITDGGRAPNIIPDYTSALFYVRSSRAAEAEALLGRVEACARGAAAGTGAAYKITPAEADFKDTRSNMTLNRLACDNMEALGVKMKWLGDEPHMGSSDMGDVSCRCPAIQLNSGMGPLPDGRAYSAHTVEFAEKAASPEAIETSFLFIRGLAKTAVDLMTKPEYLTGIKEEFAMLKG